MDYKELAAKLRDPFKHFPMMLASEYRRENTLKDIALMADYLEQGQIPKARFDELKYAFNAMMSSGSKQIMGFNHSWTTYEKDFFDSISFGGFSSCKTIIKRLEKFKKQYPEFHDNPVVVGLTKISPELILLEAVGNRLKETAFKRVPLTAEQRAEAARYVPPIADSAAQEAVRKVLTEISEASFQSWKDYFSKDYYGILNKYLDLLNKDYGKVPSYAKSVLFRLTKGEYEGREYVHKVKPGVDKIIDEFSSADAEVARQQFVVKNLRKISSIIDTKGDFDHLVEIGRAIDIGAVTGRIKVFFKDGSSFEVMNSSVEARSSLGKPFTRFPLTFHQISVPGLKIRKKMSEEEMNEEFAKNAMKASAPSSSPSP